MKLTGKQGSLTVLMPTSVGLEPRRPCKCTHPGLTLQRGFQEGYCSLLWGLLIYPQVIPESSVEWTLFPFMTLHLADEVTLAPRGLIFSQVALSLFPTPVW